MGCGELLAVRVGVPRGGPADGAEIAEACCDVRPGTDKGDNDVAQRVGDVVGGDGSAGGR